MKHVIIGTAGHVDHGKSSLIKALTQIDPDRLSEEKKRGITIDLGFAWLDLPDGGKAGIIDVPGHERFVRNMLAGAGGIDLAILLVAADEGVMPQTREHLDILRMLDIPQGIIVISKKDLVEEDWVMLVEDEIRSLCEGSFLADAPCVAVSSYTGDGIEDLRQLIFSRIETFTENREDRPFRQSIDRIFSKEGFGTVVTGTVIEGHAKVGSELMLYPQEETVRIRSIQVHGQDVDEVFSGQRAAINLAQISRSELTRGDVLAAIGSMDPSTILDCRISVLPKSEFTIKDGSRLHFHAGSGECLARIHLYGSDEVKAGEQAYCRLHLDEAMALKHDDRFVLRFYSPMETVGGGVVLDPLPQLLKVQRTEWADLLKAADEADPAGRLLFAIESGSAVFAPLELNYRRSGLSARTEEEQKTAVSVLMKARKIFKINEKIYIGQVYLDKIKVRCLGILTEFHNENKLKRGLKREELRTRLLPTQKLEYSDRILSLLIEQDAIGESDGLIMLPQFTIKRSPEQKKCQEEMEAIYLQAGYSPPDTSEILARFNRKLNPQSLLEDLVDREHLYRLEAQIFMHADYINRAKALVQEMIARDQSLKLGDFRDQIGSSRKFAVAILEYFDRIKFTKKQGDLRILG